METFLVALFGLAAIVGVARHQEHRDRRRPPRRRRHAVTIVGPLDAPERIVRPPRHAACARTWRGDPRSGRAPAAAGRTTTAR